jgi:hypothetical protein
MPMIDVCAGAGRFSQPHALAGRLAETLMRIEEVPTIPMFRKNTAAFIHELPATSISNVDGDSDDVRVRVLTNAGALDRAKQIAVVERLSLSAAAASDCARERHPATRAHRGLYRGSGRALLQLGVAVARGRTFRSRW